MNAKVIVFCCQKGGSGKTNSAALATVGLAHRGHNVLALDTDEQRTLCRRASCAKVGFPATVLSRAGHGERLRAEIHEQRAKYDFIVVDTAPSIASATVRAALLAADLAIVVVEPTPESLWSAQATRSLIEDIRNGGNPRLHTRLLANRVERTVMSRLVLAQLQDFGIEAMATQLHARTAYQQASLLGTSPDYMGAAAAAAASEVRQLIDELESIVGGAQ